MQLLREVMMYYYSMSVTAASLKGPANHTGDTLVRKSMRNHRGTLCSSVLPDTTGEDPDRRLYAFSNNFMLCFIGKTY